MKELKFDFNNMFGVNIGKRGGVSDAELKAARNSTDGAFSCFNFLNSSPKTRVELGLEWTQLPYQNKVEIAKIQKLGDTIARSYENVISLGIGGSYLGLKAAQDALCSSYYNDFASARGKRPKIYFEGNNLDPDTLSVLLKNLDPKKTFVVVISKSGETTETKAAFAIVEKWLKDGVGKRYARQIFAITDSKSGTLRKKVLAGQKIDGLAFRNLPVMKGVGGRFSEFNIGILHLAIVGISIQEVLSGAAKMAARCASPDVFKNPALMYAILHTILYKKNSKPLAVIMPFSERLKSTADWYVQLLAESLGKRCSRKGEVVNVGRTPIPARGTNDLHSIQQNNIEGEPDKVVTFIKVEKFKKDIKIVGTGDFLAGRSYSELLSLAEEATEWALAREARPSCTIIMPEITPFHWGALLFFFEMATAFEGELLDVNAFDQPGVEGYKNYLYYKLGKPGIPDNIAEEIRKFPLKKSKKFKL